MRNANIKFHRLMFIHYFFARANSEYPNVTLNGHRTRIHQLPFTCFRLDLLFFTVFSSVHTTQLLRHHFSEVEIICLFRFARSNSATRQKLEPTKRKIVMKLKSTKQSNVYVVSVYVRGIARDIECKLFLLLLLLLFSVYLFQPVYKYFYKSQASNYHTVYLVSLQIQLILLQHTIRHKAIVLCVVTLEKGTMKLH